MFFRYIYENGLAPLTPLPDGVRRALRAVAPLRPARPIVRPRFPTLRTYAAKEQRMSFYPYARTFLDRTIEHVDELGRNAFIGVEDTSTAVTHHMEMLVCPRVETVGLTLEGQAQHLTLIGHRPQVAIDRPQAYLGTILADPLIDLGGSGVIHSREGLTDYLLLYAVAFHCHAAFRFSTTSLFNNNNHYQ
jgi:hypothetical protein